MNTTLTTIDEFGRDNSLRKQKTNRPTSIKNRFKSTNWAEICDEIEEEIEKMCLEQEQKQKAEDRIKYIKITNERKQLLQKGLYDLEEGEILE